VIVKKCVLCLSITVLSSFYHVPVGASEPITTCSTTMGTDVDQYISTVYRSIDFGKGESLNPEVFNKAMHGYLNLKEAGKLNDRKQVLSVVDFTKSSNESRLWIIDLNSLKVVMHTYVAHGQGTGEEFATAFSNNFDSHQSSLGFYVTGDTYQGEHGLSLRLNGMDEGYNSAACGLCNEKFYRGQSAPGSQLGLSRS